MSRSMSNLYHSNNTSRHPLSIYCILPAEVAFHCLSLPTPWLTWIEQGQARGRALVRFKLEPSLCSSFSNPLANLLVGKERWSNRRNLTTETAIAWPCGKILWLGKAGGQIGAICPRKLPFYGPVEQTFGWEKNGGQIGAS